MNSASPLPDVTTLRSVTILGIKVHGPTVAQATDYLLRWAQSTTPGCRQIVATGFHGLWVGHNDPEFHTILNAADLFCPDGIAPILLSRFYGHSLPERVPGADLMHSVFSAGGPDIGHYFYGDTDATLEALNSRLLDRYPNMKVCGTFSPRFGTLSPEEETSHVEAINQSGAHVLWVGLGLPKQEQWIARNKHRLRVSVAIGVGAAFAFHANTVRRVPRWVGNAGFEWLWRLVAEPRKLWRRDLIEGPSFVAAAAVDVLRGYIKSRNAKEPRI